MATTCKECKCYFPMDEDKSKGDCVQRVVDPRQAYYKANPVAGDNDAGVCGSFQKK